jgi:UPF0716 family protein affecting phage T7 exclusion
MKRILMVFVLAFGIFLAQEASAQCSICTKTAQQMGHKPAKGMNTGIIYLMFAPFAIMGWVGYQYLKGKRDS